MTAPAETGTLLPKKIPVFGKDIHFRRVQMIAWALIVGALGVGLPAGAYFLGLEVHWYIHIGSFYWKGWDLKAWWDGGMGFIHSKNWTLYRHAAFRDNLEPSVFIMAVATLLAPPKSWHTRATWPRLVATPFILVILAVGMGIAGVWLIDFQFPHFYHDLFNGKPQGAIIPILNLIWSFGMARVLHIFWRPVGATVQGVLMDRSVDIGKSADRVPLWVRFSVAPPVLRERYSWMWDHDEVVSDRKKVGRKGKFLMFMVAVFAFAVMVVGLVAKYWIAKGHTVPYLAP